MMRAWWVTYERIGASGWEIPARLGVRAETAEAALRLSTQVFEQTYGSTPAHAGFQPVGGAVVAVDG